MKSKKQNKAVKICLIKFKGGRFLSVIKINPDQINELYDTLFSERSTADALTNSLISFKNTLEDQGFENSSLSQVHYYVDTLINLMEVLSGNMITLQENASEIASEFSVTDQNLATIYNQGERAKSYKQYESEKLNEMYDLRY